LAAKPDMCQRGRSSGQEIAINHSVTDSTERMLDLP